MVRAVAARRAGNDATIKRVNNPRMSWLLTSNIPDGGKTGNGVPAKETIVLLRNAAYVFVAISTLQVFMFLESVNAQSRGINKYQTKLE